MVPVCERIARHFGGRVVCLTYVLSNAQRIQAIAGAG